jgi:hypothetical protein
MDRNSVPEIAAPTDARLAQVIKRSPNKVAYHVRVIDNVHPTIESLEGYDSEPNMIRFGKRS